MPISLPDAVSYHNTLFFDPKVGLETLPDHSVQLIVPDPPYNMTQNSWEEDFFQEYDRIWNEYLRVLTPDGTIVMFSKEPFSSDLVTRGKKYFRYDIIWIKEKPTLFLEANRRPMPIHENLLVFTLKYPNNFTPQKTEGKPYKALRTKSSTNYNPTDTWLTDNDGSRYPTTVLLFPHDHNNCGIHPTQKPYLLYKWLIETYSKKGDTILDPYCGSGSSIIAALDSNRKIIAYEINKEYYDLSCQRIHRFLHDKRDAFKKPKALHKDQKSILHFFPTKKA